MTFGVPMKIVGSLAMLAGRLMAERSSILAYLAPAGLIGYWHDGLVRLDVSKLLESLLNSNKNCAAFAR